MEIRQQESTMDNTVVDKETIVHKKIVVNTKQPLKRKQLPKITPTNRSISATSDADRMKGGNHETLVTCAFMHAISEPLKNWDGQSRCI
jgi:hypothetical protein